MSSTYCPVTGSMDVAGSPGCQVDRGLFRSEYGLSTVRKVSVEPVAVVRAIIDCTRACISSV